MLIVPLLDNETVLLVREYAAGVHRYELGLPKGKTDAGETFIEAATVSSRRKSALGLEPFFI